MSDLANMCPLRLTGDMLTAWRDGALPASDAQRIADHLASCDACRSRIATFDRGAGALRPQSEPDSRAGIAAPPTPRVTGRALWVGAGALVTVALLATLLSQALGRRAGTSPVIVVPTATIAPTLTPTSSATPDPTAIPGPPVTVTQASGSPVPGPAPAWETYSLPSGFVFFDVGNSFSVTVAPSDGDTAYGCTDPSQQRPEPIEVAVTHDRGAHWGLVSNIPVTTNGCFSIAVDSLNPAIAAVYIDTNDTWITFDGGASWRPISASVEAMATSQGVTYAVIAPTGQQRTRLVVSRDQLRTWKYIDTGIDPGIADPSIFEMWRAAGSSDLFVETWPNGLNQELWHSPDNGQHWKHISVPSPGQVGGYLAHYQPASHNWWICASLPQAYCSTNAGATWTQTPGLTIPGNGAFGLEAIALTSDGSILMDTVTDHFEIYRLTPRATRWQDLGRLPSVGESLTYAPSAGGGALWDFPSNVGSRNQFATALYP